jgi:hypothetical protein
VNVVIARRLARHAGGAPALELAIGTYRLA